MWSGKSLELQNQYRRSLVTDLRVCCIKSGQDTRDGEFIHSKDPGGIDIPVVQFSNTKDVEKYLQEEKPEVLLVDEAQFFSPDIAQILKKHSDNGCEIYVASLDMYNTGTRWPTFEAIRDIADTKTNLHARCSKKGCEEQAYFTHKYSGNKDSLVDIGGEDKYSPMCGGHWGSKIMKERTKQQEAKKER